MAGGTDHEPGVSALDEQRYIESFDGTRSYYGLREAIRATYAGRYDVAAGDLPLNPGNGWVSALCFEPRVGLSVVERLLQPHVDAGRLTVLLEHVPHSVRMDGDRIVEVTVTSSTSRAAARIRAAYVLDATELGDLLPLAGAEYVVLLRL